MRTLREQITGKCKFAYSGPLHVIDKSLMCNAGVSLYELCKIDELGMTGCACRTPCRGRKPGSLVNGETVQECDKYEALTKEEIQAELDQHEHIIDCLKRNVSSCCEAPINESHVITKGQHKGHGPRFCSKCKKLVYMV